ncbi:DUF6415 family natural product biosynthesis protein [Streptomyces sp. C36]|uniref:DUF6415 family natural product biosynthesis protein n=1 Tax=Streptomyces sp. C36 TaxID=3237122 RepID=UPI0034C65C8C
MYTPWHNNTGSREHGRCLECLPSFSQVTSDIDAAAKAFADFRGPSDAELAAVTDRLRDHSRRLVCMVQEQLESSFAHERTVRLNALGRAMKVITRLPSTDPKVAASHTRALARACSTLLKFYPEAS